MASKVLLNLLCLFLVITGGCSDVLVYLENKCLDTVWFAVSPSIGSLDQEAGPGTLNGFYVTDPWTGSIWARTKCTTNERGLFTCETGDCGSGNVDCQGMQPAHPVSLLNFGINNNVVSYEVSLIHGHNLGVRILPSGGSLVGGGSGPCPVVDCVQDVSNVCPAPLVAHNQNGAYVGCNSACDALKTCQSNSYTQLFKNLCNLAHTYPGDNQPPLYKCSGAKSYNITLCPK